MNGRETFEQILAVSPMQRVVIASGYSGSDDIEKVLALGVRDSLLKPYTIKQLGQTLKKALA